MRAYGAVEAGERGSSEVVASRRARSSNLLVAGCLLFVVAAAVMLAIPTARRGASVLEEWRLGMPWEQYEFQPVGTFPVPLDDEMYEEDTPGYESANCIDNPFKELPPGFLCTSIKFGAYLLDPYGSLYNRRIQWKTRRVVRGMTEEEEEKIAADAAGVATPAEADEAGVSAPTAEKAKDAASTWGSPWTWMRPSLLPTEADCEETIQGFYTAISSPNNGNLSEATAYLAPDFVYQGPETPLLPACVPAVGGGKQVVGPEGWSAKFEESRLAFGASNSTLGGVKCSAVNTRKPLEPQMKCIARHVCTFELANLKNVTGGNVTLAGEIMDTVYIDREGEITWMKSDLAPGDFKQVREEEEGEEGEEGEGDEEAAVDLNPSE